MRGAPLIGATAAYSLYLATLEARSNATPDIVLQQAADSLRATRPPAVNLDWAVRRQLDAITRQEDTEEKVKIARETAAAVCDEDVETNNRIGEYGLALLQKIAERKGGEPVQVLTHCNAGWLGTVDWGTAIAPIYKAHDRGLKIHVWVDETRPRNQGAALTAWELGEQGVPYTVIVDNAGGHLMQRGQVDVCLAGVDRMTRKG